MSFLNDILRIDCAKEAERVCAFTRQQTLRLKRSGAVIGLSGGIDSALAAALCVRALGKEKVFGLMLPDKESSPDSEAFATKHAKSFLPSRKNK